MHRPQNGQAAIARHRGLARNAELDSGAISPILTPPPTWLYARLAGAILMIRQTRRRDAVASKPSCHVAFKVYPSSPELEARLPVNARQAIYSAGRMDIEVDDASRRRVPACCPVLLTKVRAFSPPRRLWLLFIRPRISTPVAGRAHDYDGPPLLMRRPPGHQRYGWPAAGDASSASSQ